MKPLVTTRGDGTIKIETSTTLPYGLICTVGYPYNLLCDLEPNEHHFIWSVWNDTEEAARNSHTAMVERLDAALIARLEQP